MVKVKEGTDFNEVIDKIVSNIDAAKDLNPDPGFIITVVEEEELMQKTVEHFKKEKFSVSNPSTFGKIAIVWDDRLIDSFVKSGYVF